MNRRNFVRSLIFGSAAIIGTKIGPPIRQAKSVGYLDVEKHREFCEHTGIFIYPYLDGVRVEDCVAADNVGGFVVCYERDDKGRHIIERNEIRKQRRDGRVEWMREPFPKGWLRS